MVYLIFAGFFVASLFGVHQKHIEKTQMAQKLQQEARLNALKIAPLRLKIPKPIEFSRLDGIELMNLSEARHA